MAWAVVVPAAQVSKVQPEHGAPAAVKNWIGSQGALVPCAFASLAQSSPKHIRAQAKARRMARAVLPVLRCVIGGALWIGGQCSCWP